MERVRSLDMCWYVQSPKPHRAVHPGIRFVATSPRILAALQALSARDCIPAVGMDQQAVEKAAALLASRVAIILVVRAPPISATVTFPTQAPTDTSQPTKTNNTALIAGASAGGAVALILIALGAYCALKKRPATPLGTQPKETRIDLAPTPVPYITPSADRRYSHMSTVPLARPAVPSLVGTQPTVSTVGSVLGDVSTHGPSSAYTGMGYTPSPAPAETTAASSQSGRGASYYASTPIYDLGGVSTTSQTSSNPNLATSSQRRSNTLSSQAGIANAIPPWLNGSVVSHGTNDNPMPSTSPPLGSQAAVRADISPVGSPPPPAFSPPPLDLGEGGVGYAPWAYPPEDINSGAGRVISTDAPRDTKARPSGRRV
ncbi:SubName: Full=Uncharacterized protein {ECO:0000313/EMBL:CCA74440.1} [Serendipita indica DSM 11827]|nr:SubName: Full=Uncharacterized protein {ECO:0000313/EMBL:CCA74440.1} [Serendipita indica DSM 11827]